MAEVTLDKIPRNVKEVFEKGLAAMERGNMDHAMDFLMSALDLEPRFLQARKFLRAAAIKKVKDKKISHGLSLVSGMGSLLSAKSAMNKNPLKALHTAEDLLRKDPFNTQFINLAAQAAVAAGMPEVALMTLEVARDHNPRDVDLLDQLGQLYLDTNQPEKARECYDTILRMKPNDQKFIKKLKDSAALATMQKGNWETKGSFRDKIKDAKESHKLEQESRAVKTGKDLDDLIAEQLAKTQSEPRNINYRRALAELYGRGKRYEEAIEQLQEAQKAGAAGDQQIELSISQLYVKIYDREIARLREAGQEAEAAQMDEEKKAFQLQDAQERVQRYPNELLFHYDLGVLLYERGSLNEAIQQFQLSQRNPQRRIRSLYYMALCFKTKGQYDIAMEQLTKAAAELQVMDENKKDILYETGLLYETIGNKEKAVACYKEIYSVDFGYRDVSTRIEQAYPKPTT